MQCPGCYLYTNATYVTYSWVEQVPERVFFLAIENTRFRQHKDFDWYRKPQQRILGSLTINYLRKTESRPPPTDVLPEKFQLCKW